MDGQNKTENHGDRRAADRRADQRPFDGGEKRAADRRSGHDRRGKPRYSSPISEQS